MNPASASIPGRPSAPRPCHGFRRLRPAASRAGQTLLFMVFALVILVFIVLWNFDLHKTLRVKMLSQNGGDAAALVAARWQGITLNLVGDLNLIQALALTAGDAATLDAVSNLQTRLLIHGPMIGFMAAQQAAKNNRVHDHAPFSDMVRAHADRVRTEYTQIVGPDGEMAVPEPYPGAWLDYAAMLSLAAAEGIAAAPENARYYGDYTGPHILLDPAFYDAVAGRNWCWFYHHAPGLLEDYTDHTWWPPLPEMEFGVMLNSEYFGLGLDRAGSHLEPLVPELDLVNALITERELGGALTPTSLTYAATWYIYGANWGPWLALATEGEDPFPLTGPLRPEYDYAGADAATRVVAEMSRLTPGPRGSVVSNAIIWTAAAKPFGVLGENEPPPAFPLVLPVFRDARLIPIDASSAPAGGFDPEWRRFIEEDLPHYVDTGDLSCGSWYCVQLLTWEDPTFRADGVAWLALNAEQCIANPPGSGRGGGSRRGH